MKTLFPILALSLALTGCGTNGFLVKTPVQVAPARTNIVEIVQTNFVPLTVYQTNIVTAPDGRQEARILQSVTMTAEVRTNVVVTVSPAVYYTNVALSTFASDGIKTVGNVAGAAGVPFGSTIGAGVAALAGLVFGFVNRKRRVEAEGRHANAMDYAQNVAGTLVDNFESLRKVALQIPGYTPEIDSRVMHTVQTAQALAGVKPQIDSIVDERTNDTVK